MNTVYNPLLLISLLPCLALAADEDKTKTVLNDWINGWDDAGVSGRVSEAPYPLFIRNDEWMSLEAGSEVDTTKVTCH